MKQHFKEHIKTLKRYQTSVGRDLDHGVRLDRNEKVSDFSRELLSDIFGSFAPHCLSASPDAASLYAKVASSIGVDEGKVYMTAGITEGIRFLYESLSNPGENVIVLDPTYPMYKVYAHLFQLEYRPFQYGEDLTPDLESLYGNMDEKTKFVIIPNPNLPIESVFTVEEIRDIVTECNKRSIIVIIDEAYHYFGAPTVLRMINDCDNLIVMRTFSKAYGLAGLRIGFMVSNEKNIEYISKTRSLVESNTLTMGVTAYMLDHPEIMQRHVAEVKGGQKYMHSELTRMGIRWHGGEVTNGMLIFLKDAGEIKDIIDFMRKRKIYIRGSFDGMLSGSIRVSIGARPIMEKFIHAFEAWAVQKKVKV